MTRGRLTRNLAALYGTAVAARLVPSSRGSIIAKFIAAVEDGESITPPARSPTILATGRQDAVGAPASVFSPGCCLPRDGRRPGVDSSSSATAASPGGAAHAAAITAADVDPRIWNRRHGAWFTV